MKTLRIIQAKATGNLSVELVFNDNSRQNINVGAFIKAHPHPQYNKYLDEAEFKKFTLDDGNIVWVTKEGRIIPIKNLSHDHLENIINHLREKEEFDDAAAIYDAHISSSDLG